MNNTNFIQYGWKCPECGAVMAPWQSICVNCNGKYNTTITSSSITVEPQKQSIPNSITWTSSLGNCITTDKTIDCTLTSNATTTQNKLRTTLKSAGIDI